MLFDFLPLRTERYRAVTVPKSVSFGDFVSSSDPNIDVYVRNAHFRQLANSCWTLETRKVFDDVCRFVDEMAWYYVCEYPEMSLASLRRVFDWNLGHLPRENVTQAQSDEAADLPTLDDRILKVVLAKTISTSRFIVMRSVDSCLESQPIQSDWDQFGGTGQILLLHVFWTCHAGSRGSASQPCPNRVQSRVARCDVGLPAHTSHPLSRLFACFAGPIP
jgi:hypothetical protein